MRPIIPTYLCALLLLLCSCANQRQTLNNEQLQSEWENAIVNITGKDISILAAWGAPDKEIFDDKYGFEYLWKKSSYGDDRGGYYKTNYERSAIYDASNIRIIGYQDVPVGTEYVPRYSPTDTSCYVTIYTNKDDIITGFKFEKIVRNGCWALFPLPHQGIK